MKVKDFDFEMYSDWMMGREEKLLEFYNQDSGGVFIEEEINKKGSHYTTCRTPAESLELQLENIDLMMRKGLNGLHVPFLEPWFGVGVYAVALGATYQWDEGKSAHNHYLIHSFEDVDKIPEPDFENSDIAKLVLEAISYFVEKTDGRIPISLTDTQSPLDNATLIWDTSDYFTSMFCEPDVVHKVNKMFAEMVIEFSKKQIELMGDTWARPGHIMSSARGGPGIALSDDNIVMISPEHYEEFSKPYNEMIADAFGGVAVHSCGNFERQLPALIKTEGLVMIDGAFAGDPIDPSPNLNYELFRDTIKNTGVILHARTFLDWEPIARRLYDPDLKLVLKVPPPAPDENPDKNVIALDKILQEMA